MNYYSQQVPYISLSVNVTLSSDWTSSNPRAPMFRREKRKRRKDSCNIHGILETVRPDNWTSRESSTEVLLCFQYKVLGECSIAYWDTLWEIQRRKIASGERNECYCRSALEVERTDFSIVSSRRKFVISPKCSPTIAIEHAQIFRSQKFIAENQVDMNFKSYIFREQNILCSGFIGQPMWGQLSSDMWDEIARICSFDVLPKFVWIYRPAAFWGTSFED